jgi:hypothetical protein
VEEDSFAFDEMHRLGGRLREEVERECMGWKDRVLKGEMRSRFFKWPSDIEDEERHERKRVE